MLLERSKKNQQAQAQTQGQGQGQTEQEPAPLALRILAWKKVLQHDEKSENLRLAGAGSEVAASTFSLLACDSAFRKSSLVKKGFSKGSLRDSG